MIFQNIKPLKKRLLSEKLFFFFYKGRKIGWYKTKTIDFNNLGPLDIIIIVLTIILIILRLRNRFGGNGDE